MKVLISGVLLSMLLLLVATLAGCTVKISADGSKEVIPDRELFLKGLEIISEK